MPNTIANRRWEFATPHLLGGHQRAAFDRAVGAASEHPFYRWFWPRQGYSPARAENVTHQPPIMTKADILAYQLQDEETRRPSSTRQIHVTSGTSGIGQERHPRDSADLAALGVGGAYAFTWAGLQTGDPVLLTIPYSQTMAGPYFQAACEAAGVVPVNGFSAGSEARLELLRSYDCVAISATPSHLHRLTVLARSRGLTAHDFPHLRRLFVSGEAFGLEWATTVEDFWMARIAEGWGATQTLGVALATCERGAVVRSGAGARRGTLHGLDHRFLFELADAVATEEGERGRLVITTFRTSAFPLIRFDMGDELTRLPTGSCPCGRGLSTFRSGTIGRADDMVKVRGVNIWPQAVDAVVLALPGVLDYTARVHTDSAGREQLSLTVSVNMLDVVDTSASIAAAVRAAAGMSPTVAIVAEAGDDPALSSTRFKARRWSDERAERTGASA